MSYAITINGHGDFPTQEEAKAFEEEVIAKARDFVASLSGVTLAQLSGAQVGSVNLRESQ
jgi:hypothetical protein